MFKDTTADRFRTSTPAQPRELLLQRKGLLRHPAHRAGLFAGGFLLRAVAGLHLLPVHALAARFRLASGFSSASGIDRSFGLMTQRERVADDASSPFRFLPHFFAFLRFTSPPMPA